MCWKILCQVGRENAKKRKAGRSPSSFSSYPQFKGMSDMRETLVFDAADGTGNILKRGCVA